jgi:hypothetical protein
MSTPRALAERIESQPFDSSTTHRRFTVDTSPDNLPDLEAGAWLVYNPGSVIVYLRHGAAVAIPSDKAAGEAGQWAIPPGGYARVVVGGTATVALHGVTASGSATLELMRLL